MRVYFFLPVSTQSLHVRLTSLFNVLQNLSVAVKTATPILSSFHIHLHLNGHYSPPGNFVPPIRHILGQEIRWDYQRGSFGKIVALNYGLAWARYLRCSAFISVDDDIYMPATIIREILEVFLRSRAKGVGCIKAPLVHASSTLFQREYSRYLLTGIAHRTIHGRPTGSFYCIDPWKIPVFPYGCNDGDYLHQQGVYLLPNTFVYSEYAPSFEMEVTRRVRLELASRSIKYERANHNADYIDREVAKLPLSVRTESHRRSVDLNKDVMFEVLRRINVLQLTDGDGGIQQRKVLTLDDPH